MIHHLVGVIAVVGKDRDAAVRESVSVRSSSSAALREQMVTFIDKMQENRADTEAEIVEWYREEAESAGVTLTQDEVMDEIAADFAGNMMENPDLFREFSQSNRTVAQKLLDSLKEFIAKVKSIFTGKAEMWRRRRHTARTLRSWRRAVAQKWQEAFDAAEQQAERAKTAAGEGDGVRYMIRNVGG